MNNEPKTLEIEHELKGEYEASCPFPGCHHGMLKDVPLGPAKVKHTFLCPCCEGQGTVDVELVEATITIIVNLEELK